MLRYKRVLGSYRHTHTVILENWSILANARIVHRALCIHAKCFESAKTLHTTILPCIRSIFGQIQCKTRFGKSTVKMHYAYENEQVSDYFLCFFVCRIRSVANYSWHSLFVSSTPVDSNFDGHRIVLTRMDGKLVRTLFICMRVCVCEIAYYLFYNLTYFHIRRFCM